MVHNYAVVPAAFLLPAPRLFHHSFPMLLACLPRSLIRGTVFPFHLANPIFFISDIVALVRAAVRPCELALPMHHIIQPVPSIDPSIGKLHRSMPFFSVVPELSHVLAAISPFELTLTILFVSLIEAFELGSIRPSLFSLAVALVFPPLSLVDCSVG